MSPDDPRTDEDLIEAANAGDVEGFEALYRRYRDHVVRLSYRFTGHEEDALDVLQEVFVYFLRKFPGFHLTAKVTTFLYPVVKHLSIAARRKRQRFVSNEESLRALPAAVASGQADGREDLAAVVSVLPEGQQEVLLMRFADGMSLEEISRALRIPLGTVKSRLHHALKALREDKRTTRYFE